ncbi:MAG: type II toxin-antitoxin system PemK/MazF family toxin, partial [Tepidiformaceae bacterium]
VILQNDTYNESRLRTVLICPLTTNLGRFNFPCNVTLEAGEANLPKQSMADLTGAVTINKAELQARVGMLAPNRIRLILDGLRLLTEPA